MKMDPINKRTKKELKGKFTDAVKDDMKVIGLMEEVQ